MTYWYKKIKKIKIKEKDKQERRLKHKNKIKSISDRRTTVGACVLTVLHSQELVEKRETENVGERKGEFK